MIFCLQIPLLREIVNNEKKLSFGEIRKYKLSVTMKQIEFKYCESRGVARKVLMESEFLVRQRGQYLRVLNSIRVSMPESAIIYLDGTSTNARVCKTKLWTTDESEYVPRLSGGKRYIIIYAGFTHGFVPNAVKVFFTTQIDGDYNNSMNGDVFKNWFIYQLIPKIPRKSIIVVVNDNAPYHFVQVDKASTTSSRNVEIKSWLTKNYIPFDPFW